MKTIEERAKEYAPDPLDDDYIIPAREGHIVNLQRKAYVAGAREQKAIDDAEWLKIKSSWEKEAQINHDDVANRKQCYHDAIEKACERLKEIVEGGVHPQSAYGFVERFRKAMEE